MPIQNCSRRASPMMAIGRAGRSRAISKASAAPLRTAWIGRLSGRAKPWAAVMAARSPE